MEQVGFGFPINEEWRRRLPWVTHDFLCGPGGWCPVSVTRWVAWPELVSVQPIGLLAQRREHLPEEGRVAARPRQLQRLEAEEQPCLRRHPVVEEQPRLPRHLHLRPVVDRMLRNLLECQPRPLGLRLPRHLRPVVAVVVRLPYNRSGWLRRHQVARIFDRHRDSGHGAFFLCWIIITVI